MTFFFRSFFLNFYNIFLTDILLIGQLEESRLLDSVFSFSTIALWLIFLFFSLFFFFLQVISA